MFSEPLPEELCYPLPYPLPYSRRTVLSSKNLEERERRQINKQRTILGIGSAMKKIKLGNAMCMCVFRRSCVTYGGQERLTDMVTFHLRPESVDNSRAEVWRTLFQAEVTARPKSLDWDKFRKLERKTKDHCCWIIMNEQNGEL